MAHVFDVECSAEFKAGVRGLLIWSWNNAGPTTNDWPVGPNDPTIKVIAEY